MSVKWLEPLPIISGSYFYPDLCFAALFTGESFSVNKQTAAEHLKKSPLFPNSPTLSPVLRLSSKVLHHSNSTGRNRRFHVHFSPGAEFDVGFCSAAASVTHQPSEGKFIA